MSRISLRKIDALLSGELGEEESSRLREEINASPQAKAYVDRQKTLRSTLTWNGIRQAVEADKRSGLKGWFRGFSPFPIGSIRSRGPGLAFASVALALLTLGTAWWKMHDAGGTLAGQRFTAKGIRFAEAQLQVGGQGYPAGSLIAAGPGDTLGVTYRSGDTVYVQVWYQEENGDLRAFPGKDPRGFALPPVTAWTPAPQRILLEGEWRRQEVWIVLSPGTLKTERVREAIRSGRSAPGITVLAYRLARGN